MPDELDGLCMDRQRLMRQLAPLLKRIGPNNPQRSAINAQRAVKRKQVKKALRKNADAIAALILQRRAPALARIEEEPDDDET